jgi:hypothetical protein
MTPAQKRTEPFSFLNMQLRGRQVNAKLNGIVQYALAIAGGEMQIVGSSRRED